MDLSLLLKKLGLLTFPKESHQSDWSEDYFVHFSTLLSLCIALWIAFEGCKLQQTGLEQSQATTNYF